MMGDNNIPSPGMVSFFHGNEMIRIQARSVSCQYSDGSGQLFHILAVREIYALANILATNPPFLHLAPDNTLEP